MKKTIGILAHVDAGKTSFSEQILYRGGAIRSLGRVDHRDAFLDLHPVERERGITVFSDQAVMDLDANRYYWLDTPGHMDFSSEMERVLPVLDFAVLIVSCIEGVESHTETIWRLLEGYHVPTLIFVNKCDRIDADFDACLNSMRRLLSPEIADFRGFDGAQMDETAIEAVAERDEALLDRLVEGAYDFESWRAGLAKALTERRIFPAFAGAALTGEGIDRFLHAMDAITDTDYEARAAEPFAARVYKVRHDDSGARMVYLKLLSGTLAPRQEIATPAGSCKAGELRLRHGGRSLPVAEARAGDLICLAGLPGVAPGNGLGALSGTHAALRTEPLLQISVDAGPQVPRTKLLQALRMLEEEDPELRVECSDSGDVRLRVMGGIQTEILGRLALDRFGLELNFGPPRILYMETIASPAIGIGHYEPLKHYAEVWLRLSPGPRGSGVTFESKCHVDDLALNWQRLIETHVFERTHPGVLTGAPLTDVHIELIAGRAHLKHTEGGDFRQATYRAIRNGLMQARSLLLEPIVRFSLRMPSECYGKVTGDLIRMHAQTGESRMLDDWMCVEGECPFREFYAYPEAFRAATHGRGSLNYALARYAPVEKPEDIIREARYNPLEADSPDSVFCSHGAGYSVPWNEVRAHAHCQVEL